MKFEVCHRESQFFQVSYDLLIGLDVDWMTL